MPGGIVVNGTDFAVPTGGDY